MKNTLNVSKIRIIGFIAIVAITGSEGEQTIDYKLEGKNLIFSMGDQSMTFAKK